MRKAVQVQEEVKTSILSSLSRKNLIWFIVATVLGLILRLHFIRRDFWHDESFQLLFSKMPLEVIFNSNDVHPPLFTLLTKCMVWFTSEPFFLRLIMLVISMMFAVAFYNTIKEMFNQSIATYSYFFMMLSPTIAWYSTEFRSYIFVMLITVIQIKHFNRMLQGNKMSRLLYILLSMTMLYSHYMTGLILFTQLLFISIQEKIKLKHFFTEYLMIGVCSIPLLCYLIRTLPKIQSFWFDDINLLSYISSFMYLVNLPQFPKYYILVYLIFLVAVSGAILRYPHDDFRHFLLFLYVTLPPTLMWLICLAGHSIYHHRYFLFGGMMFFALAGWGLYVIKQRFKVVDHLVFAVAILILLTTPLSFKTPLNDGIRFLDYYYFNYSTVHDSPFSATPFKAIAKNMDEAYILTELSEKRLFTSGGAVIDYENQVYSNYSDIPKSENMFWVSDQTLENYTIIYQNDGLYIQELKGEFWKHIN